jgi:TnpA family transposase
MQRWAAHYLGQTALPFALSDLEIRFFFTLSEPDRSALRARFQQRHWLGVALHLGYLRLTGCSLDAFKVVPHRVLAYLGEQLEVEVPTLASLRALYRRHRTLFEHQAWAMGHLGFRPLGDRHERMLLARLNEEALDRPEVDQLVSFARRWLYERKFLIPRERVLRDLARRAVAKTEAALYEAVIAVVPAEVRERWERALYAASPQPELRVFEWLARVVPRRSTQALSEELARLDYLRALGVDRYDIGLLSGERLRHYAQAVKLRRPSRLRRLRAADRLLQTVAYLKWALLSVTDRVVRLTQRKGSELIRQASEAVRVREIETIKTLRARLARIEALVDDLSINPAALRDLIKAELRSLDVRPAMSHAARIREQLASHPAGVRALLRVIARLPLKTDVGAPASPDLDRLDKLANHRALKPGGAAGAAFNPAELPKVWRCLLPPDPLEQAAGTYEAATLFALQRALRRGSVWVEHSQAYCDPRSALISQARWPIERRRHLARLQLPERADRFIAAQLAALRAGLAAVTEALGTGEVRIVDALLRISPVKAQPVIPELRHFRTELYAGLGEVQLPDLRLQVDSLTRFSWSLLGRAPRSEQELLSVYGALLAHGTEVSPTDLALMLPAMSLPALTTMMAELETGNRLRSANDSVVAFLRGHAIAEFWGPETTASADSMSLEATRHLWRARVDPRRRTYAVGIYTHVLDQWGIVYDQPLLLNERQAGVAIEGVVRQTTADIVRIAVDSHGFTDFGIALAKLLGFDLCPRLKNLRERRLHLPTGHDIQGALHDVLQADVSLRAIRAGWDELLRLAASILRGEMSAVYALERFGAAARGDRLYRAGTELGRLLRTVYLCDYFSNAVFRREIHRQLAHGESTHSLQRAIYAGRSVHPLRYSPIS